MSHCLLNGGSTAAEILHKRQVLPPHPESHASPNSHAAEVVGEYVEGASLNLCLPGGDDRDATAHNTLRNCNSVPTRWQTGKGGNVPLSAFVSRTPSVLDLDLVIS